MIKFIVAMFGLVGSLAAVFLTGRKSGKLAEQTKSLEKDLKAEEQKSATLEAVAEVRADVSALPASDVQRELRDKYTRD